MTELPLAARRRGLQHCCIGAVILQPVEHGHGQDRQPSCSAPVLLLGGTRGKDASDIENDERYARLLAAGANGMVEDMTHMEL